LVILYFARSATGYIVFIVLNLSVFFILLWLRLNAHLQRMHYLLVLIGGTLAFILVLMNLDVVFGFFHRNSTMTGRVGLWSQLLDIASRRLWLGHGFGAVWMLDSFRAQVQQLTGWASQPLIGDNGFLDIYLHLGIIGLTLLISVLTYAAIHSLRYAVGQKTLVSFFPLLVLIYALFANITFSLFAETEVFVWFLIVAVLFMTMRGIQSRQFKPIAAGEDV
jgi:exopolysaccharide production protein ExoQ